MKSAYGTDPTDVLGGIMAFLFIFSIMGGVYYWRFTTCMEVFNDGLYCWTR